MRLPALILLLSALALSACYEVDQPVVAQGEKVTSLKEGVWRRPDGTEIRLEWNDKEKAYAAAGGWVRAQPAGPYWLVDYQAARRLVLLADIKDNTIRIVTPSENAEKRLGSFAPLALKPGPVNRLLGPAEQITRYLQSALQSGQVVEGERLTWVGR